jgi:hypothetical protein
MRNKVNYEIRSAKIIYYKWYFIENTKNIKQSCKGINSLLGKNQNVTSIKNVIYNYKNHCSP